MSFNFLLLHDDSCHATDVDDDSSDAGNNSNNNDDDGDAKATNELGP